MNNIRISRIRFKIFIAKELNNKIELPNNASSAVGQTPTRFPAYLTCSSFIFEMSPVITTTPVSFRKCFCRDRPFFPVFARPPVFLAVPYPRIHLPRSYRRLSLNVVLSLFLSNYIHRVSRLFTKF